jgi:hypothetical protein
MSALRAAVALLLLTGCAGEPGADPLVRLETARAARLKPALELADGSILRFDTSRLTADSAYFAEPPAAVLPGRHRRVRGTLRASVCENDAPVCRALVLEL